jgi:hypothetical protein
MEKRDIEETVRKLSDEIEILRTKARDKGLAFHSLTTKELETKLTSPQTPFITSMSWTSRGPTTSSFNYSISVYNPDTNPPFYANLFAYFFFGPADMVTEVGIALLTVDQRLYRGFAQFPYIASNTSGNVEFNYSFSSSVPLGIYVGNGFIFNRNNHGADSYIDRTSIDVEIV